MEDDLQKPFQKLSVNWQQSLVTQLLEIQKYQVDEPRSFAWARSFTCLFASLEEEEEDATDSSIEEPTSLVKRPVQISDGNYIAVSWRWENPSSDQQQNSNYLITSESGCKPQHARVSDTVLDRIIRYAHHIQVPAFWIDKECINQDDVSAKSSAVQVMDLVYRCSRHPIALLTTPIQSRADLGLLSRIVSGKLLATSCGKRPRLARSVTTKVLQQTVELLIRLTSDPWWTRRWTYQEEYCSYRDMKLLIPHHLKSFKYSRNDACEVMDGEVLIRVAAFREQVTRFCLACTEPPLAKKKINQAAIRKIYSRAESYTVSHRYNHKSWTRKPARTLSTRILADVASRGAEKAEDVLAIVANCCGYSIRLDCERLIDARQCSLSLNLLALSLLNGELMRSESRGSLGNSVLEYVGRQTFSDFDLPVDEQELTFMKQCRFPNVRLCEEGIRTTGYIWEKRGTISTEDFPYVQWDNACPIKYDGMCLRWLSEQLEARNFHKLAMEVDDYLDDNGNLPENMEGQRLGVVFDQTVSYIIDAIEKRQNLAAARLLGYPSQWGIFVESCHSDMYPRLMFTASEPARFSMLVEQHRSPAKYVSLEVDVDRDTDRISGPLRIKGWMNGLTFPGRVPPGEHIFEWPKLLRCAITSP